jgi:orotidine-5'-phosphate decarboxylase
VVLISENFADRLISAIKEKKNPSCVGLDPRLESIPKHIKDRAKRCYGNTTMAVADAFVDFNTIIINAVHEIVPAVKPQMAFYEKYGPDGVEAFQRTCEYAKKQGLVVIEDAKRNDIGSTAQAYADGHLGHAEMFSLKQIPIFDVDAITVTPYLGQDGIKPFVKYCVYDKGIFILDRTSNPSAADLQDRMVLLDKDEIELLAEKLEGTGLSLLDLPVMKKRNIRGKNKAPNYVVMALNIDKWGSESPDPKFELMGKNGYTPVGAVVGATYPTEADVIRKIIPEGFLLGPGYGAQGATGDDASHLFNEDGFGAIINSSRGIIFAYTKEPYKNVFLPTMFGDAAREAAINMREDIVGALKKVDKWYID